MPTKIADPPSTVILSRLQLIAAIKAIDPDFEAGDEKSLDYLRGYYSHAADPVGGTIAKSTDPLNPGPGGGRLDAIDEAMVRTLASRQVARIESATRWCATAEQRASAIARLDARDAEESIRAQERDARFAEQRLDSSDPDLSPVVRARIAAIERGQARSRANIDKNTNWGCDPNDPEAA